MTKWKPANLGTPKKIGIKKEKEELVVTGWIMRKQKERETQGYQNVAQPVPVKECNNGIKW